MSRGTRRGRGLQRCEVVNRSTGNGEGNQETDGLDLLSDGVLVVSPKKLVRVRVADAFVDVAERAERDRGIVQCPRTITTSRIRRYNEKDAISCESTV